MANTRSGNTWFVDTAFSDANDDLDGNVVVTGILLTPTAANAVLVLSDPVLGSQKLDLRLAATDSKLFDFSTLAMQFRNGIRVTTLTNAKATLVTRE